LQRKKSQTNQTQIVKRKTNRGFTMNTIKMCEETNYNRRRFLGVAAMGIAAAESVMIGSANAQSRKTKPAELPTIRPGTNTSFGSLKQIEAVVEVDGY